MHVAKMPDNSSHIPVSKGVILFSASIKENCKMYFNNNTNRQQRATREN